MSAQITQFKAAGVNAIVLTVAHGRRRPPPAWRRPRASTCRSSAATRSSPWPAGRPGGGRAEGAALRASPITTFDKHPEELAAYEETYPDVTPSLGVLFGLGMSETMKQVIDAACENGDLTRAGVRRGGRLAGEIDTGGLIVPLRRFETGKSPSLSSFILQPADVPGGATVAAEAFEGEFAEKIAG